MTTFFFSCVLFHFYFSAPIQGCPLDSIVSRSSTIIRAFNSIQFISTNNCKAVATAVFFPRLFASSKRFTVSEHKIQHDMTKFKDWFPPPHEASVHSAPLHVHLHVNTYTQPHSRHVLNWGIDWGFGAGRGCQICIKSDSGLPVPGLVSVWETFPPPKKNKKMKSVIMHLLMTISVMDCWWITAAKWF